MNKREPVSKCGCHGMSRRQFLAGCAACAAAAGSVAAPSRLKAARSDGKTRIRVVYSLHGPQQTGPDWPNKGFDFRPVMQRINTGLARRCPGFEFVSSLANGPDQAKKILEQDKSAAIDGYLVYQMNCWNRVVQTMATAGKPVLYADFQYGGSGGFLVYTAGFLRSRTPNVGFVASSRIEDLAEAVKCFELVKKGGSLSDFVAATARVRIARTPKPGPLDCKPDKLRVLSPEDCMARMKESRILAVRGQESGPAGPVMGIPMENVSFAEVNDAWKSADKDMARAVAGPWRENDPVGGGV
jgi:hypothetical protein